MQEIRKRDRLWSWRHNYEFFVVYPNTPEFKDHGILNRYQAIDFDTLVKNFWYAFPDNKNDPQEIKIIKEYVKIQKSIDALNKQIKKAEDALKILKEKRAKIEADFIRTVLSNNQPNVDEIEEIRLFAQYLRDREIDHPEEVDSMISELTIEIATKKAELQEKITEMNQHVNKIDSLPDNITHTVPWLKNHLSRYKIAAKGENRQGKLDPHNIIKIIIIQWMRYNEIRQQWDKIEPQRKISDLEKYYQIPPLCPIQWDPDKKRFEAETK